MFLDPQTQISKKELKEALLHKTEELLHMMEGLQHKMKEERHNDSWCLSSPTDQHPDLHFHIHS